MIVITNIDTIEIEGDYYSLDPWRHSSTSVKFNDKETYMDTAYVVEQIRGRRFRRPSDGSEITIGTSKQAQDIIGIQVDCWDAMEQDLSTQYESARTACRNLESSRQQVERVLDMLSKTEKAPFLTRLKWLFTGVKV